MPRKQPLYPHVPKSKKREKEEWTKILYCKECDKQYATWRGLEEHFKSTGHIGIGSLLINEELLAKIHPEFSEP